MKSKMIALGVLLLASAGAVSAIAAGGDRGSGGERGWHRGGHGMGGHMGRHAGGRHGGQAMMRLKQLDADNDGSVSLDEFMKPKLDRFAKFDQNADGTLNGAELTSKMQERSSHRARMMMARLDVDGDGKVSKDEFEAQGRHFMRGKRFGHDGGRRFGHMRGMSEDASGPQPAAPNAASDAKPAEAAPQADVQAKQADRGGRGARRAQMFANLDANGDGVLTMQDFDAKAAANIAFAQKKRLHVLDKDRDGKVSREEFAARPKQRFADLDLDGDGKITASDLPPRVAERWHKGADRK